MCEDDDCTDDAEVKISYTKARPGEAGGPLETEELLCDVHGAARMKALLTDPTASDVKMEAYDEDEDEDLDDDDEDEDEGEEDGEESAG